VAVFRAEDQTKEECTRATEWWPAPQDSSALAPALLARQPVTPTFMTVAISAVFASTNLMKLTFVHTHAGAPATTEHDWITSSTERFDKQLKKLKNALQRCDKNSVFSVATNKVKLEAIGNKIVFLQNQSTDGLTSTEKNVREHQIQQQINSQGATSHKMEEVRQFAMAKKQRDVESCIADLDKKVESHVVECMARPLSNVDAQLPALRVALLEKCQQMASDTAAQLSGWVNGQHASQFSAAVDVLAEQQRPT